MGIADANKRHVVYWIHLKEQTDIFSQGYIGVTCKSADRRFYEHCWVASSCKDEDNYYVVHRAINKYGAENLIVDTLLVSSRDYCYEMEGKLRPTLHVGWNIAPGGRAPGLVTSGTTLTTEHKMKLSEAHKGKILSEETKKKIGDYWRGKKRPDEFGKAVSEAKKGMVPSEKFMAARKAWGESMRGIPMSEERKAKLPKHAKWLGTTADKKIWADAIHIKSIWDSGNKSAKRLAKYFGTLYYSKFAAIHNAFKSGWNPSEDSEYLKWREEQLALQERT